MIALRGVIGFLGKYGHLVALAAAIAGALWYAYHTGVTTERQAWKDKQDEITSQLRSDLREANEESRKDAIRIAGLKAERDSIVANFQDSLADGPNPECISADGLQRLNDALRRLRTGTPNPRGGRPLPPT